MTYLMIMFLLISFDRLLNDAKTREAEYTKPLATMPANAKVILDAVVANDIAESTQAAGRSISAEDKEKIILSALKMLAEGSVAQRNWEMNAVRKKISNLGYLFSWFLKQKGLSYEEIEKKFSTDFNEDKKEAYLSIIASAARSNPDLYKKFFGKITGRSKL